MARRAELILSILPDGSAVDTYLAGLGTRRVTVPITPGTTTGGGRGGATVPPVGGGGSAGSGGGARGGGNQAESGFFAGWNKAGGLGAAIGTVTKYALAYKLVEAPINAVNSALDMTKRALIGSAGAWTDYEEQMAKAARTMRQPGLSTPFLKDVMGRDALDFITRYRVSLEQAAQAQYELGSAGFTAAQTMQTYQVPLKVAIGLQGDVTQTTRLLTQMLKIHGQQMGSSLSDYEKMVRIGAIMAKTWEIEQVELSDLAAAYKYVAGSAAVMNVKAEELIPTLGFLSTYGLRGSIGGTGLNQFFMQASKNMKITEDQLIRIQKAVRGGGHTFDLGIKTNELTSPLQILIQMAKAVKDMKGNLAGQMKVAGIFGDVFNIRGARPAQLLSDLEKLGQLLGNIQEVTGLTTAESEKLINKYTELMQNTPNAQLEIMRNNLYKMGVDFVTAAGGADTFTGSLINLNSWLRSMDGIVVNIGLKLNVMGNAASMAASDMGNRDGNAVNQALESIPGIGKLLEFGRHYSQNKPVAEYQSTIQQAQTAGSRAYGEALLAGKTEVQAKNAAKAAINKFVADTQRNLEDKWYTEAEGPGFLRGLTQDFTHKYVDKKRKSSGQWNATEWLNRINDPLAPLSIRRGGKTQQEEWLDIIAGTVQGEQAGQKAENERKALQDKVLQNLTDSNYNFTEGGRGKGSGGHKTKPIYYRTGQSVLGYKLSAGFSKTGHGGAHNAPGVFDIGGKYIRSLGKTPQQVMFELEQAGFMPVYENKALGDNSTGENLHVMTPGMTPDKWLRWGNKKRAKHGFKPFVLNKSGKYVRGDTVENYADRYASEVMSQIDAMLSLGSMTTGGAAWQYGQIAKLGGLSITERARALEQVKRLGVEKSQFGLGQRNFARSKRMDWATDTIEKDNRALETLTLSEELYGKTVESTAKRIELLRQTEKDTTAARDEAAKQLADWTTRYKQLYGIMDDMNKGKLTKGDRSLMKQLLGSENMKPQEVEAALEQAYGQMDGLKNTVEGFNKELEKSPYLIAGLSKEMLDMPLAKFSAGLDRTIRLNRARTESRGANYDMSDQYLKDLRLGRGRLWVEMARLMMNPTPGNLEKLADLRVEYQESKYTEKGALLRRSDWLTDMGLKTRKTRMGWFRGNPKQMAQMQQVMGLADIQAEMQKLRREFADPAYKSMLDDYEKTMTAEALARPWLDARDKIEGEWSDMFTNVFSEMASGNKDALWSGIGSIVKSMQGQIVQGWVHKYLGGFFDNLATQQTGIDPKNLASPDGTAFGEFSSQANTATFALTDFTSALQMATGALGGVGVGMGGTTIGPNGLPILGGYAGGLSSQAKAAEDMGKGMAVGMMDFAKSKGGGGGNKKGGVGRDLGIAMQNYAVGSMFGGAIGGALGYDSESAGLAGGLGYAAGMALGFGPWGAAALGLAAIFGFGKKKKKPQQNDPQRDIYGMPSFEWESYLYNMYDRQRVDRAGASVTLTGSQVGSITVNVNGGDTKQVMKAVQNAITGHFGPMAAIQSAGTGY